MALLALSPQAPSTSTVLPHTGGDTQSRWWRPGVREQSGWDMTPTLPSGEGLPAGMGGQQPAELRLNHGTGLAVGGLHEGLSSVRRNSQPPCLPAGGQWKGQWSRTAFQATRRKAARGTCGTEGGQVEDSLELVGVRVVCGGLSSAELSPPSWGSIQPSVSVATARMAAELPEGRGQLQVPCGPCWALWGQGCPRGPRGRKTLLAHSKGAKALWPAGRAPETQGRQVSGGLWHLNLRTLPGGPDTHRLTRTHSFIPPPPS